MRKLSKSIEGSLLGLMVGDSIGLPYEGLSTQRVNKLIRHPLRQRLCWGKGMISDDTEHAVFSAASLVRYTDDAQLFQSNLAWRLRWWLLRLPAGIGLATARAILKLWIGFPARNAGVFSAGNGPSMRAPILGVCLGDSPPKLSQFIKASTRLTHTDPKAEIAALAIAWAAYVSSQQETIRFDSYRTGLRKLYAEHSAGAIAEFESLLDTVEYFIENPDDTAFLESIRQSQGISGYSYHTVPSVLYLWGCHSNDYAIAIEKIIRFGGDTDTTAAILGGIIGARGMLDEIPQLWVSNIMDWPITPRYLHALASLLSQRIEGQSSDTLPPLNGPCIVARNGIFLLIVLLHGFRRLLPPYSHK